MDYLDPLSNLALPASILLLLTLLAVRLRQRSLRGPGTASQSSRNGLDTVLDWPPQAARVLTRGERRAHELLRQATPELLVLAQVPLSRFIRVPRHHAYREWLRRAGSLSADLLVCDSASRVLAVIDVQAAQLSEGSRKRHERMSRVLHAAGIAVQVWNEDRLPEAGEVRRLLTAVAARASSSSGTASRPAPLIPIPEITEVLSEGDLAAFDTLAGESNEPVPSGFYDELESASVRR
jgi:hypothetical protein